jgi:TonB family protein
MHCEAPEIPPLARQAGIRGYVSVNVLVNDKGNVSCVQAVRGHAMPMSSAIDVSKKWTFVPKKQNGKEVWFYGQIRFQFLGGQTKQNSCVVAR